MSKPTVFIVEDDDDLRNSLQLMIHELGLDAEAYSSPRKLLSVFDPDKPGCLVLDLRLPEMSGLDLQKQLYAQGSRHPFIVLTAYGEVSSATEAMKLGALDYLEKPFYQQYLIDLIHDAIKLDSLTRRRQMELDAVQQLLDTLTRRERQVLDLVVNGRLTKQIAKQLEISHKTVEIHRSNAIKKMRGDSLIEIVLMMQKHYTSRKPADDRLSFHK